MSEENPIDEAQAMRDLKAIRDYAMPFGRFKNVPLFDLSADYLGWFSTRGWPAGRLGQLMQIVYQMKVDGLDSVFDEFRRARGGRTSLIGRGAKEH